MSGTFELDGVAYSKREWGVYWSRATGNVPKLFKKPCPPSKKTCPILFRPISYQGRLELGYGSIDVQERTAHRGPPGL